MPRSKSRNRKRNRIAKNRKNEKESLKSVDKSQTIKKMERRLKGFGKFEIKEKQSSDKKISAVVLEMLKPLLDEADSFEIERNIIQMGIIAWNMGVVKTYKGDDEMHASLKEIKPSLPDEMMDILMTIVKRKCSKYKKYDQFIYDYQIKTIPGPKLNLTVAYESVNTNHQ